jgi:hypothetical protein
VLEKTGQLIAVSTDCLSFVLANDSASRCYAHKNAAFAARDQQLQIVNRKLQIRDDTRVFNCRVPIFRR